LVYQISKNIKLINTSAIPARSQCNIFVGHCRFVNRTLVSYIFRNNILHRNFDESWRTTRHGILLRPARVYGLIRNNIFNYGSLSNNYGNVQVYEVLAVGRVMSGRVVRGGGYRGCRDSQLHVPYSRISQTVGSDITDHGGYRCDFLRISVIWLKCVSVVPWLRIYVRVIAECTCVSKTIWSRTVIIKRGILDDNIILLSSVAYKKSFFSLSVF